MFIHMPRYANYTEATAYHPTSLSTFLPKSICLPTRQINRNGYSNDSMVEHKEIVVIAFLVIGGAFDQT